MKRRTSLGEYVRVAVALLVILSGADAVRGQQDKNVDLWMTTPSDLSLAVTVQETPASDPALTSVEQGKPNLDQAFEELTSGVWKSAELPLKTRSSWSTSEPSTSIAATSLAQRNRRWPSADGWV